MSLSWVSRSLETSLLRVWSSNLARLFSSGWSDFSRGNSFPSASIVPTSASWPVLKISANSPSALKTINKGLFYCSSNWNRGWRTVKKTPEVASQVCLLCIKRSLIQMEPQKISLPQPLLDGFVNLFPQLYDGRLFRVESCYAWLDAVQSLLPVGERVTGEAFDVVAGIFSQIDCLQIQLLYQQSWILIMLTRVIGFVRCAELMLEMDRLFQCCFIMNLYHKLI